MKLLSRCNVTNLLLRSDCNSDSFRDCRVQGDIVNNFGTIAFFS
jgi:hypothetical protein